jgi:hypothetical protein
MLPFALQVATVAGDIARRASAWVWCRGTRHGKAKPQASGERKFAFAVDIVHPRW